MDFELKQTRIVEVSEDGTIISPEIIHCLKFTLQPGIEAYCKIPPEYVQNKPLQEENIRAIRNFITHKLQELQPNPPQDDQNKKIVL